MRKAVISASAFAVVAPLLLAGTASQANAATSCYATSCTGLAAASTTCVNDAEVIYSVNIVHDSTVVGNIQLRYSPSCRATWARVISDLTYGSEAYIQRTNQNVYEFCYGDGPAGTGCNTAMLDDANVTSYALGAVYVDGNDDEASATTASF
jgi:hypothetical protein